MAAAHNTEPAITGGISLLTVQRDLASTERGTAREISVLFVKWSDAAASIGRQCELDRDNSFKWTIPGVTPTVNYAGATMIMSRVPAEMGRVRYLRTPIAPWILKVYEHSKAQFFSGPMVIDDGEMMCELCACGIERGLRGCEGWDVPSFKCAVCTSLWHMQCADYAAKIVGHAWSVRRVFICPVCA